MGARTERTSSVSGLTAAAAALAAAAAAAVTPSDGIFFILGLALRSIDWIAALAAFGLLPADAAGASSSPCSALSPSSSASSTLSSVVSASCVCVSPDHGQWLQAARGPAERGALPSTTSGARTG